MSLFLVLAIICLFPQCTSKVDATSLGNLVVIVNFNTLFKKEFVSEEEGPVVSYSLPVNTPFYFTQNGLIQFPIDSVSLLYTDNELGISVSMQQDSKMQHWRFRSEKSHLRFYYDCPVGFPVDNCPIEKCTIKRDEKEIQTFSIKELLLIHDP